MTASGHRSGPAQFPRKSREFNDKHGDRRGTILSSGLREWFSSRASKTSVDWSKCTIVVWFQRRTLDGHKPLQNGIQVTSSGDGCVTRKTISHAHFIKSILRRGARERLNLEKSYLFHIFVRNRYYRTTIETTILLFSHPRSPRLDKSPWAFGPQAFIQPRASCVAEQQNSGLNCYGIYVERRTLCHHNSCMG